MADRKCGLKYCDATVADYREKLKTCPCLKCLGDECDACDMYRNLVNWGIDAQRQMCQKCSCYNGR